MTRDIVVPTDHTAPDTSSTSATTTTATSGSKTITSTVTTSSSSAEGVDSSKFYRLISQLPDKHQCQ